MAQYSAWLTEVISFPQPVLKRFLSRGHNPHSSLALLTFCRQNIRALGSHSQSLARWASQPGGSFTAAAPPQPRSTPSVEASTLIQRHPTLHRSRCLLEQQHPCPLSPPPTHFLHLTSSFITVQPVLLPPSQAGHTNSVGACLNIAHEKGESFVKMIISLQSQKKPPLYSLANVIKCPGPSICKEN